MTEAPRKQKPSRPAYEADGFPRLQGRNAWLIQLRWVAVAGVAVATAFAIGFGWILAPGPLMLVALMMAVINLAYQHGLGSFVAGSEEGLARRKDTALALQISVDLCLFTMTLHWSGGVENPFAFFYVFHMVLGTMLFPRRVALLFGLLAFVLFGTTVVAEAAGWIPHFSLLLGHDSGTVGELWRSPLYLVGYLFAFGLTLLGVILFVSSVDRQRYRAEKDLREQQRILLSRERLVRIGELSAGVAHTVRNPLHGVLNCVDFLRRSALGDNAETKEVLDLMEEGLQRIENVTKRLLTLTRDREITLRPTQLNELIQESIAYIDPRLNRTQVTVRTQLSPLPTIPLDSERFGEILINLLDNAVHACRDGGAVTICTHHDRTNHRVVLEVRDSGEGLPETEMERLFDPFFTTKSVGEGSGLGLAMAQRVVEEHGGTIDATTAPNGETVFTLRLPVRPTA